MQLDDDKLYILNGKTRQERAPVCQGHHSWACCVHWGKPGREGLEAVAAPREPGSVHLPRTLPSQPTATSPGSPLPEP